MVAVLDLPLMRSQKEDSERSAESQWNNQNTEKAGRP